MFKRILFIFFILSSPIISSSEDAISNFVYDYLKRINKFIDEEDYLNAKKELDIFSRRYFKNEQSYERALINQLYGNYYAVQGLYEPAIEKYELSLKFRNMPLVTALSVRKNLAQCYFALSNYEKTIEILEAYMALAKKRGQLYPPKDLIMLGIAYFQTDQFKKAYTAINEANERSTEYKEDWLNYELAITIKLEMYDEALDVAQLLLFVNPDKKEYWKQISGLYYTVNGEDQSLASLELAYENNTLSKEKEFLDLSRYYLYKDLPQKAVNVIQDGISKNIINKTKENYELLADSFFFLRDRDKGIQYLIKALEIEKNANTAFKIGRFAFEEEDWLLAIQYLKEAKTLNYDKSPGRLDLLIGIANYETGKYNEAIIYFKNALEFEETKTPAEGWLSYIDELKI